MDEFKWIQMFSFVLLTLQFTAAATRQLVLHFTVRDGDQVSLPCNNMIDGQQECNSTTWIFNGLRRDTGTVELITHGQIGEQAKTKSDRLSVTKNCSLVIKKVSAEGAGRYTCRQFDKSGHQQGPDSQVHLSVVTMTERGDADEVTLNCSVWTYERCGHTVKWLFNRTDVDKENHQVKTSQSSCSASLKVPTSHFIYESRFDLKCEVTDGDKVQFLFSPRPSGEDTTTTTTTTMKPRTTTTTTTMKPRTTTTKPRTTTTKPTKTATKPKTTTTSSSTTTTATTTTTNDIPTGPPNSSWWLYVLVAVALLALLIIVVKVIRWRRSKGSQTGMKDDVGLTSNPAGTQSAPEPSQDTADPEDGVSYASISYTKKTNRKGRGYEHEAVTYSTVKAAAASSSASADPSSFYATINKPMQ